MGVLWRISKPKISKNKDQLNQISKNLFQKCQLKRVGASYAWQNKYETTTSMRPGSLHSCTG